MVACEKQITLGSLRWRQTVAGFRLIEVAYPGGLAVAPHFHENSNITIVLRGGLSEQAGITDAQCGPGCVVLKPAGTIHSNRFSDRGATTFVVEFPAGHEASADDHSEAERRLHYGWRQHGDLVRRMLELLAVWRTHRRPGTNVDSGEIEEQLLLLLSCLDSSPSPAAGREPLWIGRVRNYLDEAATTTITVRHAARLAGVHPVHLARVFRRCCGVTMHEYVHRIRVRRAADQLASSASFAEIAFSLGFADQAHFCRVFKSHIGVTPGRFRRVVRG